ncbi:MAG TPA: XRE family transcriptional regulator [Kiritimatiellia bacterium]|mgnify:CR=1 FL=1|jgi:quercetin dioxygenase-like cupin family protein|nr:cupin domain-containing protein [Kiritimatiellia bacterium]OQC58630.1 MAG: Cupin domain protein [Verrucomicrobia bacterium ADurb.Bin018]MBP9572470.1 cupin domain-containing protein [Kiritimatiellia bacterium]HOD99621.1 XRE family transcriptional regulator [Kiritimatiellia bacterium]HOE36492.1 XRE family transcriptional regulator [Kiritimatiellia bacterium]
MQEQRRDIAARLKERRELEEKSAQEVAAALGVSAEVYESYEAGSADIPASALHEAALFLNADLTELLTGEAPRMKIFCVTRQGGGVKVERRKDYQYRNLAANFAGRKMNAFEVTVPPDAGEAGTHANSHPGQEFNYVLEGRMRVTIHGNELILETGDCVYFDSNYGHAMQALDGRPVRFLAIII